MIRASPGPASRTVGAEHTPSSLAAAAQRVATNPNPHLSWALPTRRFVITGLGSAIMGVGVGLLAALCFKVMGMGRRGDLPHVECTIFAAFA